MKTALVHDWLMSSVGGAENVLQEIHSLFPSPIYTVIADRKALKGSYWETTKIIPSWIAHLPWSRKYFRLCLPLFPAAIETFNFNDYDLILSSSHCVAKGIQRRSGQLHICYCHTPMRYIWDLSDEYLKQAGCLDGCKGVLARYFRKKLQKWDKDSSNQVDYFIANSLFVAERIRRVYGRESTVIYPPVDTEFFQLGEKKESFYLTFSRLVPYKKVHLIVKAFSLMPQHKLVVIGDGPDLENIRLFAGKNIELMGYQPRSVVRDMVQKAKAFVFAAIEDFGIAPVEAMSAGTPVIALRKGGSVETVVDQVTGLFFDEQTVESLCDAVVRFENHTAWDALSIRQHALRFSYKRFREEYRAFVEAKINAFRGKL